MVGYDTLLDGMFKSLNFLPAPAWPAEQKRTVESFVLRGLDFIPQTAGIPANLIVGEAKLVLMVEKWLDARTHGPAFCAAFLRKWRSAAVSSVLQARGVLHTWVATSKQRNEDFEARTCADIATHGLRDCALPSCSKTEKTVKEFSAPGVARRCTAAWSTRRWTGRRTQRRAKRRRRRGWQKRRRKKRWARGRRGERESHSIPSSNNRTIPATFVHRDNTISHPCALV